MPIIDGPERQDLYNAKTKYVEGMGQSNVDVQFDAPGFTLEKPQEETIPPLPTQEDFLSFARAREKEKELMGGEKPDPSFWGAEFRQENEIASAVDHIMNRQRFVATEGYDVMDDIRGTKYEQEYDSVFIGSVSHEDTTHRAQQLERELADRKEVMSHGAGWNMIGAMTAGLISPLTFIPLGGSVWKTLKSGKTAISIAKSAAKGGALVGLGTSIQEGHLQATQDVRPIEESLAGIGMATILGCTIGRPR